MSNGQAASDQDARAGAGTAEELKALKEDLERLRADVGDLLRSLKGASEEKIKDARSRLREAAASFESRAEQQIKDAYERVSEEGKRVADLGREQVEKRPLTSVFVAFLAGVLVGKLFSRR